MPRKMTMKVEPCCNGGRRLTYTFLIGKNNTVLTVESRLDGSEAPVLMDGKPITVIDDFTSTIAGNKIGKETETWVRQ